MKALGARGKSASGILSHETDGRLRARPTKIQRMKALLVKMSSLGDVVHALPAVTDAAREGVRFDWVVEEAFQAVPAAHPAVDRVFPIAWRRWRRSLWRSRHAMRSFLRDLAGEHYDLVIDSQGLLKSALVASRARALRRVGFSRHSAREPIAAAFYNCPIDVPPGRHAVERQRQLFATACGLGRKAAAIDFGLRGFADPSGQPTAKNDPGPQPEPSSEHRCLMLHGTTWPTKLWPEAMWIALARLAKDCDLRPVLPWGSDAERARAERIANATGATLLPSMNLGELMEELRRASVAIGVDSGLAHLAGALDVPTVVLYGPTSSALTGCLGHNVRCLQANFACSPCLSKVCRYRGSPVSWRETVVTPPCSGTLDPQRVWAAVETMRADRILHI